MNRLRELARRCRVTRAGAGAGALLAALVLTVVSAATLALNVAHLTDSQARVARMAGILRTTSDTLESLRAAETGQRGYLLTGQARYLATYEAGLPRSWSNLGALEELVADTSELPPVQELRTLITAKLAELAQTVALAGTDREMALRIVRNDSGQQLMEQIETVTRAISGRGTLLLNQRWAAEKASIEIASLIAVLTGALALGCTLLGAFLLVRMREQIARERADRASAAKTEFLATMSHEIRTPLNGVLGYAELLLEQPEIGSETRRYAERIQSAGSALLTIVNDILDFSKVEAGQVVLHSEAFSSAALIDNTASIVRAYADQKGVELNVTVDPAVPADLVGDQDRLRQVLLNLLNNALKFTTRGKVDLIVSTVRSEAGTARLRFVVRDTGIGISPMKRHLLFERFSQVDGSIQRDFGGTGLGLAISKRLVTLMGGEIGVESEVDRGSTFWFEVSLAVADGPMSSNRAGPDVAEGRGRRLLLVEDVPLNQELACAVLRQGGRHEVDVVSSGQEAIQAVQDRAYDLVLMDVQMPGMDGLTATRHIRALNHSSASVPIIALTANVLPQQIVEFRAAGMDDHVAKPFKREALFAAIQRWARPSDPSPANEVLDRAAFADTVDCLGPETTRRLLGTLAEELEQRFGRSGALLSREETARAAHAMIGTSGSMGFLTLSRICSELETACVSGGNYLPVLDRVQAAKAEVLAEIVVLRAA